MQTYNGVNVPSQIKTNRIISAFANCIEDNKVEKYTQIMRNEMLSHSFPPIMGYPTIITDQDVADSLYFMTGEEIPETFIGQIAWMVTDGHHRTLAAIEARLPYLETELDYSTITNETDLKNLKN